MKYKTTSAYKNWLYLTLFMSVAVTIISIYAYVSGIEQSQVSSERFEDFVNMEMKKIVQMEVLSRIDEIDYDLAKIIEDENIENKKKVLQLKTLVLGDPLMNIKDLEERKTAARLKLEPFIVSDSNHLYFILDSDGKLLRSGIKEIEAGLDTTNMYAYEGVSFLNEAIKAMDAAEGIYITYYWPKIEGGEPLKKTSFCLYIPELDFIIGTGSYEDDVYTRLREETFSRMQSYYVGKESYIFMISKAGDINVYPQPELIGQNVFEINNSELVGVHEAIMNQLDYGNGFVSYEVDEKVSGRKSQKISYVHTIDAWDSYIGMGYHTSDTVAAIANYSDEYRREHTKATMMIISMLILALLGAALYIRRGVKIQKIMAKKDDMVFEQLFELVNGGIVIVSNHNEILYKNDIVKAIFKNQVEEAFTSEQREMLEKLSENIFLYKDEKDRAYYLEVENIDLIFRNNESQIYFVQDISERYTHENELLVMAYYDLLTSLPNRRKLQNDYEDIKIVKTGKGDDLFTLAMLDLDHFKDVNDTYGHDVGDKVLVEFSQYIQAHIREENAVYRYGGEEFVVIFDGLVLTDVAKKLAVLSKGMAEHMKNVFGFSITFSAGAVMMKDYLEQDIVAADQLLYQAKKLGRNRTEIILMEDSQ